MKTDNIEPDLTNNGRSLTSALNQDELILFDYLKKALLEIFPLEDVDGNGKSVKPHFSDMSLELAECFAFNATKGISGYVKNIVDKK